MLLKNVRLIAVRREYVQNHYTISSQSLVGFLRFGVPGVTCEYLLSDTKKIRGLKVFTTKPEKVALKFSRRVPYNRCTISLCESIFQCHCVTFQLRPFASALEHGQCQR